MAAILIKNGFVITQDKTRRLIEKGAVLVKGDRIEAVGDTEKLSQGKFDAVIDASEKLVMPGLVNAHVHLHSPLSRGLLDDVECVAWIVRTFSGYYPQVDEERYYLNTTLCCLEMIKTGTTTFCDCGTIPIIEKAALDAALASGIRGVLGRSVMDIYDPPALTGIPEFRRETTDKALSRTEEFINQCRSRGDGRIIPGITLLQVPNGSDALCQGVKELHRRYSIGLQTHASVTEAMVSITKQRFGQRDIERMASQNLLGPHFLAAHAGWLDGKEMWLLKESNSNMAHIPSSSMHGAYGSISRGKFPELVSMGVNVALGCDGASCSNHFDMIRQMYLTATTHKEARLDPELFTCQQVLDMATLNGARALGLEKEIGSLEVGKKADIVILDLMKPGMVPYARQNLVSNLVYSATGNCVDTVIVDGNLVMEAGELKTIDERKVLSQAQEEFKKVLKKIDWVS
jgi:5-methylthioadenosine/S-adenosylhomocysteine deaminase